MKTYLDLKNRAQNALDEAKQIHNKAEAADRALSSDEQKAFDRAMADFDKRNAEAEAYGREHNLADEIAKAGRVLHEDGPLTGNPTTRAGVIGPKFRDLFGKSPTERLDDGGFRSFGEFVEVIASKRLDPRLQTEGRATMTEGVLADGGYLVPVEYSAMLLDASLEGEVVRPRATVWPMKSYSLKVPRWSGYDHQSNLFGGFSGTWLGEGATATQQKAKTEQIGLTAHKLAIFAQLSRELEADAGVEFGAQLQRALVEAIGWYMDYAFLRGDGSGKPLGVIDDNNPALIEVTAESGQGASTIVYENVIKMFARLHPSCIGKAVWVASQTTLPQLMTLCLPVGTGGSVVKAVEERGGQWWLLGRPLVFTEKLPALGTKGDILLADFSQYVIGMRQTVRLDTSNAVGWTEDLIDWRAVLRVDGQSSWSDVVTPKNGDSLSWCVTLSGTRT